MPAKKYYKPEKSNKSTHLIENVDYSEDSLLCVCGWLGKAYGSDFRKHQKESEPWTGEYVLPYEGDKFNRALRARDSKELTPA